MILFKLIECLVTITQWKCSINTKVVKELLQKTISQSGIHNKHMSHYVFLPSCRMSPWQNFSRHIGLSNISIMPTLANHAVIFSEPFLPCGYYYELLSSWESITNFPLHSGNNLEGTCMPRLACIQSSNSKFIK
jgi:hypothetical protein